MAARSSGVTLAPPLIYLIFVLFAWALSRQLPIPLPDNDWTRYAGWGLIDAGLLLMIWAALLMARHKTTINPFRKPQQLLEKGPFRFSRNPIYLGDTLIYCGIGLLLANLWPWLLLPLLIVCMNRGVIRYEESLLTRLFGDAYRAYQARVRRWL
ncbi:methyltransferase family protein [Pseudomonas indica]|uniref:methyltransferase family protein n=1 Tax=Pseudomonas indica TaxID=137658 RepID=UPI0023F937B1|nr:isoprenylcysteine carboxylmethyltransferase family protein [Pseudomonas indica]MBU3055576.1 isoprenylcysteine carboxylmethyltransferase family protein [Pseudomonas indica]